MLPKTALPAVSISNGRQSLCFLSQLRKKFSFRKNSLASQIPKLTLDFKHANNLSARELYLYVLSLEK